jgi:hypothetical protein
MNLHSISREIILLTLQICVSSYTVHPFGILLNLYTVCIDFCINYQNKTKLAGNSFQTYLERLLIHKRRPTINFVKDIVGSSFYGRHISSELLHTSCQLLTSRNTCSYYLCLTFSKTNETRQCTVLLVCKQNMKKRKAIFSVSYCSLIVVCYFSTLFLSPSPASAQQWHILTLRVNDAFNKCVVLVIFVCWRLDMQVPRTVESWPPLVPGLRAY